MGSTQPKFYAGQRMGWPIQVRRIHWPAVIEQLARHLASMQPGLRGLSAQNIWRMRQFDTVLIERVVLSPAKVSPLVTQIHPGAASVFKDSYLVEFLDLPATHLERYLQRGLLAQLRQFLLELGRDFCFVGS